MAKKAIKQSRLDQYRAIVESYGKRMEDCTILAFEFETEAGPGILHYELMYPLRPVYSIFDNIGNIAQIVVPKDAENERMLVALAESCGGEKISPILN